MRRLNLVIAATMLALAGAAANASDSNTILGTWKTPKHDGKVVIATCGNAICGHVIDGRELRTNPDQADVRNPDPEKRTRKIMGLNILEGYSGGPTEWSGGSVYDPQTGDSSDDSTLTLQSPDVLIVKGCRFLFCRSETWRKIARTASAER
jgi:uncharacterized protein (DUF2147 family)